MAIYTICQGTGQPRCVEYDYSEEKMTVQGEKYFQIQGHYFDYDGRVFGEAKETLEIEKFREVRRIETLSAFPLAHHPDKGIKKQLISYSRTFISMMGSHYCQYHGNAFFMHNQSLIQVPVNGRVMIDAGALWKINPNYPRLQAKKLEGFIDLWTRDLTVNSNARVKSNGTHPSEMNDKDLLICSPTLLGFSFREKF